MEVQWVLYKSLHKLIAAQGLYRDGLLHAKIFSDSCEYGYKNCSIDLIEPSLSYTDLYQFATKGLEMSFYLQIAFFQRFENNADTEGMKCLDDMAK